MEENQDRSVRLTVDICLQMCVTTSQYGMYVIQICAEM